MSPEIAVIPGTPAGALVAIGFVVGAVALSRWARSRAHRPWTSTDALRSAAVAAAFMLFVALLPVRAHAIGALLAIAMLLGWMALLTIYAGSRALILHRYRRGQHSLARGERTERYGGPVSEDVRSRAEALRAFGFEAVTTITDDGSEIALWFRPADSVAAEVGRFTRLPDQPRFVELTSSLASQNAALCTSTWSGSTGLWAGEFRQAFPGAPLEHLLDNHERGLAFLAGRGLTRDPVRPDEIVSVRGAMLRLMAAAAAMAPRKSTAPAVRSSLGSSRFVGRLEDQPDIASRLDAFWNLAAGARGG